MAAKLKPFEINAPEKSVHVLIATQGSDHKMETLDSIVEYYTGKDVYISIIDVSGLSDVQMDEWNYVVLFSAIQMYDLTPDVEALLNRVEGHERIFLFNTSGGTQVCYDGVDAITSASVNPQSSTGIIIEAIDMAIAEQQ